jgi:hypothetical protein
MTNELSDKIVEEIQSRKIAPRPRWRFLLKRWVLWSLAIGATVLGGIAIAVITFIFFDHDAQAHRYLEQSELEDILLTIPYVWLVTLAALIAVTKYAVRHTTFGYRYTTTRIVGAVLAGSIVLGLTLNTMDIGQRVHDYLAGHVPYYGALISTSKDAWSHPEKGLLGGTITAIVSSEEFELADFHANIWRVDSWDIEDEDNIIRKGATIKIVGTQQDSFRFQAKEIFPWNNEK